MIKFPQLLLLNSLALGVVGSFLFEPEETKRKKEKKFFSKNISKTIFLKGRKNANSYHYD